MKKEHASDLSHLRKQASQPMQEDNMTGRCSRKRLWTDTSVIQAENATRKQANWAPRMSRQRSLTQSLSYDQQIQIQDLSKRWFPTKETGLLSGIIGKGRKLSLYAWETAFPAICFIYGGFERKTTEYRELKDKDFPRSISGIEPACPKYELGERDRDKDPMDVPLPSLSMWYLSLCSVKTFSQCRKVEQLQGLRQRVQLLPQVEIKEQHLNLRNFPIWIWRRVGLK